MEGVLAIGAAALAGVATFCLVKAWHAGQRLRIDQGRRPGGKLLRQLGASTNKREIQRRVPEMIDAVALGMRAGLSFDRAFRLYAQRFDDQLARMCRSALLQWESGLTTRQQALDDLAKEANSDMLMRFSTNVNRALRLGSPLSHTLDALAREARQRYRAQLEEQIGKAPVKMLVPTATLILPAMMIVVLGPVLLEFV